MKLRLEQVTVWQFKSGDREGELRPFEIPDDATIVSVSRHLEFAVIYYTRPVS